MTLIVEDGSIVTNANSYVDVTEARAFAASRGITLSAVDATLESELIRAMDYLESKRDRYQGVKTDQNQSLQWPRMMIKIDGYYIDSNVIPEILKNAQMQLAIEIESNVDLQPTVTEAFVIEDTVGPLTTRYSEKQGAFSDPVLTKVNNFLKPLLKRFGSGGLFSTRV